MADGPWNDYAAPAAAAQPPWMDYGAQQTAQSTPVQFAKNVAGGIAEPVLNIGSSMLSMPAAGLAGLGAAATKALGLTTTEPADVVQGVQSALTYQPRTEGGQAVTNYVTYPFQKIGQGADYVGGQVASATGSPALGAVANTAIQSVPALVLHRAAALVRGATPAAAGEAASTVTPEATARAYATNTLGLDWNSLSSGIKQTIQDVVQKSGDLSGTDAQAVARQARLGSLDAPVPATYGQLTRDPVQLRNEGNVSATAGGKPIRDIYVAANKAIVDNLNFLKGKVSGEGDTAATAQNPEQVGGSIQDAARAKLDYQKGVVSSLYKQAESSGELQGTVKIDPIADVLNSSPDLTHLGWVDSWLKKVRATTTDPDTGIVTPAKDLSLKELEDLRQGAVARAMDGGTEGYYAGKVIRAIDQSTDGAGGVSYQAARAARKAQAMEFQDQGGVANLVDNDSRTDRSVALENTWKSTVLNGSIQDLRNVKKTLLTGGNADTITKGTKAWNDLRAQTIQYITDQATKSVARFEDGTPNVTPAAMEKAIKSVGNEKLEEIFGTGTVTKLHQIMEATRDVKTEPPTGFKGSPTFANMIAFLERGLGKIPLLGDTVSGAVRGVAQLHKMGQAGRDVNAAQQTPIGKLAEAAQRAQGRRKLLEQSPLASAALSNQNNQ